MLMRVFSVTVEIEIQDRNITFPFARLDSRGVALLAHTTSSYQIPIVLSKNSRQITQSYTVSGQRTAQLRAAQALVISSSSRNNNPAIATPL